MSVRMGILRESSKGLRRLLGIRGCQQPRFALGQGKAHVSFHPPIPSLSPHLLFWFAAKNQAGSTLPTQELQQSALRPPARKTSGAAEQRSFTGNVCPEGSFQRKLQGDRGIIGDTGMLKNPVLPSDKEKLTFPSIPQSPAYPHVSFFDSLNEPNQANVARTVLPALLSEKTPRQTARDLKTAPRTEVPGYRR